MIQVDNDRLGALRAGWEALSERAPDIEGNNFDGFDIQAFKDGDKVIGMLMTRCSELHVAILPEYRRRWLSARLIKQVLGNIIDKYGYVSTSVMKDNVIGQDFVERIGFKRISYSNGIIYYRMKP
jgi:ribosomal protein S18 acetylase RimI-like enzyme